MARAKKAAATEEKSEVTEEVKTAKIENKPVEMKKADERDIEIEELKKQNEALQKQFEAIQEMLKQAQSAPQVVQVAPAEAEKVHFLFEAEVADDNIFSPGENGRYGRIIGKTGSFYVPKNEISAVMDAQFRAMLENRWIIVVSGLTDEEREAFGVDYKEGEYLDKKAFAKMVDLGEEILEIYPKLCKGHQEMVAKRYYEAYTNGNPKVTRELVVELNKLSKKAGSEKGDFIGIIEMMNEADTK